MRSTHLAFDLGAESGRALLGELRGGRLAVREIDRFPNGMIDVGGHQHWDVFRLFEEMKKCLSICAREGIRPNSVGVDTWGVDFALLDDEGKLLELPYAYRDSRTVGAMESFFRKMPREEVYRRTGIQLLPINTLFQIESMVRDKSPALDTASSLLFIPDLFHYWLTGVKKTELTFATTSQLYNPDTQTWDDEILSALPLHRSLMQEIVSPRSVLGMISGDIETQTGFARVPLVAVATHDTASAVAAVPAEGNDWAFISSGTWSLMGVESAKPVISEQSFGNNFTNEGGVAGTFRVLKNIMGLWLLQQCRRAFSAAKEIDYPELIAMAESAPPFVSLVDPDDPSFLNPPDMPAAIREYCARTRQPAPESPGARARCVLESVALKYRFVLEQARKIHGRPIRKIHIIGGGSKNRLLCRFTADATGLPVFAGPVEATAVGNLLVQAMAHGAVTSLAHLREVVRNSFAVEKYGPENTEAWDSPWKRFLDLNPV